MYLETNICLKGSRWKKWKISVLQDIPGFLEYLNTKPCKEVKYQYILFDSIAFESVAL